MEIFNSCETPWYFRRNVVRTSVNDFDRERERERAVNLFRNSKFRFNKEFLLERTCRMRIVNSRKYRSLLQC